MATKSLADRLWPKVDKTSSPDGCWLWTGARNGGSKGGYGLIWLRDEYDEEGHRTQHFGRVHIIVYELLVGPVPEGAVLDHVWTRGCRNRHCCNPEHLQPVTQAENVVRTVEKNRHFCPRWHPRTEKNTQVLPSGYRRCLTCREESHQRQLARARERRRLAREERQRQAEAAGAATLRGAELDQLQAAGAA